MGRPAKFGEDLILDAALSVVADGGPAAATMAAIADRLGAPIGSLYHRFRSRDQVLAHLWIRTVRRFQEGFLRVLESEGAEDAALYVTRWCREHLAEARVLVLYRREDLVVGGPDDLATLDGSFETAIADAARRLYGVADERVGRIIFAVIDVPYAAVRRHLAAGTPPPAEADEYVVAACRAVL